MIADRYYYGRLTDAEKRVYKDLYDGLRSCQKSIRTKMIPNAEKAMDRVFEAITADNPHLFYVNPWNVRYEFYATHIDIFPGYLLSKTDIPIYRQKVEAAAGKMLTKILAHAGSSEFSKESALYTYMAKNCKYDNEALKTADPAHRCKAHSMLGVFLDGKAVCEGFAKAFKFMMNAMDMKCLIVHGSADWEHDRNHAWNIVKINNKSYHVDVTWAISRNDRGFVWYDYLNVSDYTISIDHSGFGGVPKCEHDDLDYYKTIAPEIDNTIYLKNHIKSAIKKGEEYTTFRLVRGKGKCGISSLSEGAMLVQDAIERAHQEVAGAGFEMEMQYSEKRGICGVRFNYV